MGAQVSKQSNGTHENVVSASNGAVVKYFNINYYKDSASSGLSRQDFSQDPSKFTQPLVDTLTNPALMSPTVEACGFSDRLKQITIGNSTITTQDSLNSILAYGEWPTYLSDIDATSVDKPTHPETSADRFYTLRSVNWGATSKGWWWKFPDALSEMGVFGQNMYYHAMGRSGYIIHTQCNATKFHSGAIIVAVVPEHQLAYIGGTKANVSYGHTHPGENGHEIRGPDSGHDRGNNNPDEDPLFNCNGTLLGNITIFPHQIINLRTNNSSTIIVPYINCTPMDSMLKHNNVSLVIIPIVPLRVNGTGPTTIPITVSVAPYKSEFSGAMEAQRQGLPTRMPSGAQQFMTTEDEQSANILPGFHPSKKIHIPGMITNVMHMARVDSFIPLNNIEGETTKPSVYCVTVPKKTNDNVILVLPLEMDNTLFSTTLLGEILNYFANWSGSITITFMCVCDAFSTGKFLLAYTPPGGRLPQSRKEAMLGVHVIWDLGLQSSCTIVVPWISSNFYRRTKSDSYTEAGYVSLWYQTDFIPSVNAGTGTIIATCSACPDMSVRMMRDSPMMKQEGKLQNNDPVESFIHTTLEEVLVVPDTKPSGPQHTTKPSALGAMEIGASSDATPESVIETRYVYNTNTNAEADIEMFLGRSALWANLTLRKGFTEWDINFQENAHIRKKFELFTYIRFDMEVTIVTNNTGLMQIMFVPPGITGPKSAEDIRWDSASNPSVFYQPKSGFPRFTIPFTGLASAYYMFYDGYSSTKKTPDNQYGIAPTNDMGILCFRALDDKEKVDIKVFVKPKHITAWVPRPPRAVQYTHKYSTNYHYKADENSPLEDRHFITTRESIKNVGPSDMYVHTQDAKYMCAHLTQPGTNTILLAISSDLQVDSVDSPGDDVIPACDCTVGCYFSKSRNRYFPIEVVSHDWYEIQESEYYPKHIQYNLLIGKGHCQPGDCGGKLLCKHGVIGMITAGGEQHVAFIDLRPYSCLSEHQGVISDYFTQLGNAFGEGFTTNIQNHFTQISQSISDKLTGKVIKWLVRIISALTIMIRNNSDLPTILATLALLGCSGSPWSFLKDKICDWLGIQRPPKKQGDSWLRKFTECCNAAKGLEWISLKIGRFIDWLKEKLVPTVQRKREILGKCKKISLLEEQANGFSSASSEDQQALIIEVDKLKKGLDELAPLYAVENKRVTKIQQNLKQLTAYLKTHRHEPVCVLLHGNPGCGKSLATSVIARGLTTEAGVYSLPPDPKHFDGYDQQKVVIMDDLGQNPDGKDLAIFCQMVSTTDFIVPMAALEDKGKSFTSQYILASTNLDTLSPPTITIPEAIKRRFFIDADLVVMSKYRNNIGLLDTGKALTPCTTCPKPPYYKSCCPLLCGKAVVVQDRKTKANFSINTIVEQLKHENECRRRVKHNLEAIFQGLGDDTTPGFIVDLLSSSKDPKVIEYCAEQGWIGKAGSTVERDFNYVHYILNCLGSLIIILGTIYALYKLMCLAQGPYSGLPQPPTKRPELRKATLQGPEHEFIKALIKRNCHVITTDRGEFNMLGIHDNCAVVPTHAECGDIVNIDGREVRVLKQCILTDTNDVDTEITLLWLDQNEKFRDIRRFIPEHQQEWSNMHLATNVSKFPMMDVEIGRVIPYGNITLSGNPTCRLLKYDYPTKPGQCGGVIANTGNIVAIHVGGNGRVGYGATLLRKYFAQAQGEITSISNVRDHGYSSINTPTKTKLQPSVFYDVFPGGKEPAALSEKDPRLEVDLKGAVLSKYKGNSEVKWNENIQTAVDHYTAQLYMLDINPEPITINQAIYGMEHLEPLDLTTSAGFPYVLMGVKKKDLINKTTKDVTKMQEMMDKYGIDLPYVTYLKDELRAPEKIKKGKTRAIEAASINDTVQFRMIFGNLFSTFHANPGILTGSAVGCNPDVFWSQMHACMDGELLAFDYTNYDGSLHPVWFRALGDVLDKLGFPGHLTSRLCNTTHIYKDQVYTVEGGMPSGICGTSIFNTIINNLIIRTLVLDTYKGIDLDKLKIVAYGDDVVVSYPFKLDPQEIANSGKSYGLTITPPDKGETFTDVSWSNVTFLKRGFRPDKKYEFLIHPVYDMKDVYESIRWTKDPKNTQDHVYSLCLLAWHNGEDIYEEFRSKIRSTAVGRSLYTPPYSVLYRQWIDLFV
ncbi:polyprotein [Rhinovirus C41]|uniref:Genome polyprotein n=4 Tax=Rhinovirus C TaxID=463676 RepID=A0A411NK63_9ENTO|nr:polyprotein [Rhinovirus C41]